MWKQIRDGVQRQERDRSRWPQYEKLKFPTKLRKAGESVVGPIYFGRAFASPPEFTWSLSRNAETTATKYPALGTKPVDGINPFFIDYTNNLPTDSKRSHTAFEWGSLTDGSFEHQGLYPNGGTFPSLSEWASDSIPAWVDMIPGTDGTNRQAYQTGAAGEYASRIASHATKSGTNDSVYGFPLVGSNWWVEDIGGCGVSNAYSYPHFLVRTSNQSTCRIPGSDNFLTTDYAGVSDGRIYEVDQTGSIVRTVASGIGLLLDGGIATDGTLIWVCDAQYSATLGGGGPADVREYNFSTGAYIQTHDLTDTDVQYIQGLAWLESGTDIGGHTGPKLYAYSYRTSHWEIVIWRIDTMAVVATEADLADLGNVYYGSQSMDCDGTYLYIGGYHPSAPGENMGLYKHDLEGKYLCTVLSQHQLNFDYIIGNSGLEGIGVNERGVICFSDFTDAIWFGEIEHSNEPTWALSDERVAPAVGDTWPGRWSAKATISAGKTPWLQPFGRATYDSASNNSLFTQGGGRWEYLYIERFPWNPTFDEVDTSAYHQWIMDPGAWKGQRATLWVYATGTVTVEAEWALTRLDPMPLDDVTHNSVQSGVWHTEVQTSEAIGANGWREVTFDFIPPEDIWPNTSQTGTANLSSEGTFTPNQTHRWAGVAVRFRVKGNTDPDVWLDNARSYPLIENVADAPSTTIGVSEWITDEQGAFVGCYLWVKASNV